jgi:hypothetical protein
MSKNNKNTKSNNPNGYKEVSKRTYINCSTSIRVKNTNTNTYEYTCKSGYRMRYKQHK